MHVTSFADSRSYQAFRMSPCVDGTLPVEIVECPAQVIVFGDVNDPGSRVSKLKASERSYGLLTELQTKPRTTYLAAVRNPNPEIAGARDG